MMKRSIASAILSIVLAFVRSTDVAAAELRLDARALFDKAVTENLHIAADGTSLELQRGNLFEDDGPAAGFSYKPNEEKLSQTTWIKKEFILPNPRATKATLLIGSNGSLQALSNGQPHKLEIAGKAGMYWQMYGLPPDALKAGKNDIVLYGTGKVWIARDDEFAAGSRTRTKHPNRSAKSIDAGKTWDYDRLGTNGDVDGEYYVRLFLDQFRPKGTLTLPVFDVGNLAAQAVSPPLAAVGPIRVALNAETGPTGKTSVRVRSGTTFLPSAKTWTNWHDLSPDGRLQDPAGRFLQVAVELATTDPLQSPKLKQIVIDASPKKGDDWTKSLRVLKAHNETIVRTSIPFEYEPFDHPELKTLRATHKLDDVVKGANGEFELITRLAAWSSRQWSKGHLGKIYPPWNALEILAPFADGKPVGGFCQQYNLVFLQACESFGLPGRAVSIGPGGLVDKPRRGGHEVVEIWSNEHKKWIFVDGDLAWYAVDRDTNVPLNLWELRQRQLGTLAAKPTRETRLVRIAETDRQDQPVTVPFGELRLIPRSNFLERKAPLPLNQGMRGWFWTGHHVWTDTDLPAALLYGNRVANRRNWDWSLNQAHYVLEATANPGELRVHLDTETPSFTTFLADFDDKGRQPVVSPFLWQLHKGPNRLEVLPRNSAGRDGIASWIVLTP